MVKVRDHIRLSSMKGPDREGVVTAVTGPLVRVRWPSDQETTLVPAPGTLTVVAAGTPGPRTPTKKKAAAKVTTGKRKNAASSNAASSNETSKKQAVSKLKSDSRPAP